MSIEEIITKSTSRATAQASDINLRETPTRRLVFRPTILLDNHRNSDASVKGTFLYQKRSKDGEWVDWETISLNSIKSGEVYKLALNSEELLKFITEIRPIYELQSEEGNRLWGDNKYVKSTPQLKQLTNLIGQLDNLTASDLSDFFNANAAIGSSLITKLLNWAVNLEDPAPLIEYLVELNPTSLGKLSAAVGLQSLKNALSVWESNKDNSDEEFWQTTLTEHSFVLEQTFSWPTSIVKGKAYIGGKSLFNTGGKIVDFLTKNRLTQNAALIEIKTPSTQLLGPKYRDGVYNTSKELSGSIMQTLDYKHSLQKDFSHLTNGQEDSLKSFNPQCAVIIGNAEVELDNNDKKKSFELFRHQFSGVSVLTFDELFSKTKQLIELLENPVLEDSVINDEYNDLPF